ncbi:serine threonine-protein phosphatase 4 regulatory subunit 2 [Pseudohyphozyma bogoriensis]|nr:serine threonine-protein phosphatase 4 regulatory subunit 2 [Pseudohyphozyma bogoriensis]
MNNGFIVPPPALSDGFEWAPTYDETIGQIAATNVVDAEWPILRDMLKYKLAEAIAAFLSSGPPYALAPEDAFKARTRAYEMLDTFTGPPFTIQRLCELSLTPKLHYTSLPKYLRAVNRVISVTSPRSAYTEDDSSDFVAPIPSTSASAATTIVTPESIPLGTRFAGGPIATRRPAAGRSPSTSPRALPVVVPLLSPIPWLVKDSTDGSPIEDLDLAASSGGKPSASTLSSPPLATAGLASSPPKPGPVGDTSTPTGGVVDEVDPGSGGAETVDPVAISSTSGPSGGISIEEEKKSLMSRFVRASSPRVGSPAAEEEEENGVVDGSEKGEGEGKKDEAMEVEK